MKYFFADFVLDDQRFELTKREGQIVSLQVRALDLLLLLVRIPNALNEKEKVLQEIWGMNVSRSALPSQVLKLRKALGDTTEPPRFIPTVQRKGLRFIAQVDVRVDLDHLLHLVVSYQPRERQHSLPHRSTRKCLRVAVRVHPEWLRPASRRRIGNLDRPSSILRYCRWPLFPWFLRLSRSAIGPLWPTSATKRRR